MNAGSKTINKDLPLVNSNVLFPLEFSTIICNFCSFSLLRSYHQNSHLDRMERHIEKEFLERIRHRRLRDTPFVPNAIVRQCYHVKFTIKFI